MSCSALCSEEGGRLTNIDTSVGRNRSLADHADEVLRRRADSLARETEEDDAASRRLALLLFRIGEEWYAVRASDVREIFQEYDITPLPCVPDFILGVVNVRGEILSVSDPARLMSLGSVDVSGPIPPSAIVISLGDVVTAMVVDEIGDITEVPNDAVEPAISIIDRAQADYISGSVYIEGTMVGLISIERMLEPVVTGGRR